MRTLETPRLLLVPTAETPPPDALDALHRFYADEMDADGLTRAALEREVDFDVRLAQNDLGHDFGRPALIAKADGRRIGHAVFLPRRCTVDERAALGLPGAAASIEAEIGWAVSSRCRNQGYATEAARALVAYGFEDLGLARLIAVTEADNAASLRVMAKLGMRIAALGDARLGILRAIG